VKHLALFLLIFLMPTRLLDFARGLSSGTLIGRVADRIPSKSFLLRKGNSTNTDSVYS
jgi:hypothetical protein